MDKDLEEEKILAMAVACIAEETGTDAGRIIVRSFREVQKSSLQLYIENHDIPYQKYQLEVSGS